MGVSLLAFRCAHASKVGVLRANGATPHPPTLGQEGKCGRGALHRAYARPPHASRKQLSN
ncbi:MAG: hypothetical protein RML94_11895 [Bacteroidia bacterium]|nr:hypothetical protein [Bacteroidia bacterium]